MRPNSPRLRSSSLPVRAFYPVAELSRAGNVPTYRLLRLLRYNGIIVLRAGRACYVSLDEIRRRIPTLYRSLRAAGDLRHVPIREDASRMIEQPRAVGPKGRR